MPPKRCSRQSLSHSKGGTWTERPSLSAHQAAQPPSLLCSGAANRSRHDFVVPQLLNLTPMRSQHLRTRMINGHQQTRVPLLYLSRSRLQSELMIVNASERIKRDGSESNNNQWINELDCALQKRRTVCHLGLRRFAVCSRFSARIAKRCTGDEDLFAS